MKYPSILLLLCLILSSAFAHAKLGCLANSMNLRQRYDTKAYHPVSCNCPCGSYKQMASRNQCIECGHFHDPQQFIIVTPSAQAALAKNPYPENPQKSLQELIIRFKKTSPKA